MNNKSNINEYGREITPTDHYKEQCRFYDRRWERCTALKDVYCEKEEKMCAFFKEKE